MCGELRSAAASGRFESVAPPGRTSWHSKAISSSNRARREAFRNRLADVVGGGWAAQRFGGARHPGQLLGAE
jgi:hypothetical protein